jgi:glycosyltransferase involved in cell wall biosynthesis
MARADALHTDCHRDARLALEWGFPPTRPLRVLPSGGGVQLEMFHPSGEISQDGRSPAPVEVINPRGMRAYVRNDTFFQAIPLVIERNPVIRFLCPGMAGDPAASRWAERAGPPGAIELLPRQTREGMAGLFRRARMAVSLTTHDGTPNTLLEAMACGCFPIAGDLESVREWITPGVNGTLVDPGNPNEVAEAILSTVRKPELMASAAVHNLSLVREKADYGKVMAEAEEFYELLAIRR